ncbi:MAG: flavin reductase family protein [Chlorobiota bacterium]
MPTYDLQDILNLEKFHRVSLINKMSGLRSANLIGTKGNGGVSNLAVFNSVTHIGAKPPLLGFILRPLLVERHTYDNIKENKYYTINHVNKEIHQNAHMSSAKYPSDVSEFDQCGLTEVYIDDFPAPFVEESKIKIGLSFQEEVLINSNKTILMIGRIEKIILPDEGITEDGDVDFEALDTVGIGGLDTYYECKRIDRYEYARPYNEIKKIETSK